MDSETRARARAVIGEISSYDACTTYRVDGDNLKVKSDVGLKDEQRALIRAHKPLIVEYLSTPPEQTGQCVRGHERAWACTEFGTWVCSCYFNPPPLVHADREPEAKLVAVHTTPSEPEGKKKDDSTGILPSHSQSALIFS